MNKASQIVFECVLFLNAILQVVTVTYCIMGNIICYAGKGRAMYAHAAVKALPDGAVLNETVNPRGVKHVKMKRVTGEVVCLAHAKKENT